ncbi:MAG: hypothetical protein EA400_01255 [Chromatiaceae bacterium]|nr:MAG: hypothetical protein EA400_01255 [Chromatiaceae bacterium]
MALARGVRSNRSLDCYSVLMDQPAPLSVKACKLRTDTCGADADLHSNHLIGGDRALGYDNGATDQATWLADLPDVAKTAVKGAWLRGDVLVVWGIDGAGSRLTAAVGDPVEGATGDIQVADGAGLRQAGFALISDCEQADLFEIDTFSRQARANRLGHAGDVNASVALSRFYNFAGAFDDAAGGTTRPHYQARVFPFRYEVSFICCVDGETGALQTGGNAGSDNCRIDPRRFRPSLCRYDVGAAPPLQAVVPDIADLRLTFSGEGDGALVPDFAADDIDPIPTAHWVSSRRDGRGAWSQVSGVKVEFLVASFEDNLRTPETAFLDLANKWPPSPDGDQNSIHPDRLGYDLLPAADDRPEDRRLYQRFVTNLAIRSRTRWYLP